MKLFTTGPYTFSPKLRWALLTLLVVYLLSSLGFWQLHRADEKRTMLEHHAQIGQAAPVSVDTKIIEKDQPIQVTGTYDSEHVFFLDNQFHQHQIGYEVIEPVLQASSPNAPIILVSRGWVPAPTDRKKLPALSAPTETVTLDGTAYFPSKSLILLGHNWDKNTKNAWPKRIEKIDIMTIQKWLKKPVYPFILRLNPDEPNGFIRDWPIVSMPPERHVGYAVQWFAMAFTVFIIFVVLSVKKKNVKKKQSEK